MDELDFPSVEHTNNFPIYKSSEPKIIKPSQPSAPIRKVVSVKKGPVLSKEEREKLRKKRYHKALAKGLITRLTPVVVASLSLGIAISKYTKKGRADVDNDIKEDQSESIENTVSEETTSLPLIENTSFDDDYVEFTEKINSEFEGYYVYTPAEQSFDDDYVSDSSYSYKEINANIDAYTVRYCEQIVYDKIMYTFGENIKDYSAIYGVDPNYVASLIMVEVPDYDIEKDTDYNAIGVGQYKGQLFDGDVFKAYNFETKEYDSYTFDGHELLKNPDLQVKVLCMDIAGAAKRYDYNLYAMLEYHNKGSGSVSDALEILKNRYNLNSKAEVLENVDPTEITEVINKIGDPNYTSKAMTYMDMCLKENAFDKDYISFETEDGKTVIINLNVNKYSRS